MPPPSIPDAPEFLPIEGRREWVRVATELDKVGILTECDRGILTAYCRAWAQLARATKETNRSGIVLVGPEGGRYQNPWMAVANKAAEQIAKFGGLLGLDPTSRTRIRVDASKRDEMDEFLSETG